MKITPRLYRETNIKVGGFTIWADLDSPSPETILFNGEEYAVLWRGRTKTVTHNKDNETTDENNNNIAMEETGKEDLSKHEKRKDILFTLFSRALKHSKRIIQKRRWILIVVC